MNDDSIIATQARSLIEQLRQEQEQTRRKLEREAIEWRRERLREARQQARQRVHRAVGLARERHRREIAAARADIDAEHRRRRQLQLARLLARVMGRLPAQLVARWHDPQTRRRWVTDTLDDALNRLGASAWTIRHAPGLEPGEMPARHGEARLTWQEDTEMDAGLVIEKAGARMDASIAGLLANPTEVQSRILSLLRDSTERSQP